MFNVCRERIAKSFAFEGLVPRFFVSEFWGSNKLLRGNNDG